MFVFTLKQAKNHVNNCYYSHQVILFWMPPVSPAEQNLLLIHPEAPEALFMLLLVPCWNKKAPINHQISHRSSPRSRLTFILSHYSKIQLSAPTFSSVFALRNTWSGPFTAAEHWINLTSPQVWPSDKSPVFCTLSCVFVSLQTTELLGVVWSFYLSGDMICLYVCFILTSI